MAEEQRNHPLALGPESDTPEDNTDNQGEHTTDVEGTNDAPSNTADHLLDANNQLRVPLEERMEPIEIDVPQVRQPTPVRASDRFHPSAWRRTPSPDPSTDTPCPPFTLDIVNDGRGGMEVDNFFKSKKEAKEKRPRSDPDEPKRRSKLSTYMSVDDANVADRTMRGPVQPQKSPVLPQTFNWASEDEDEEQPEIDAFIRGETQITALAETPFQFGVQITDSAETPVQVEAAQATADNVSDDPADFQIFEDFDGVAAATANEQDNDSGDEEDKENSGRGETPATADDTVGAVQESSGPTIATPNSPRIGSNSSTILSSARQQLNDELARTGTPPILTPGEVSQQLQERNDHLLARKLELETALAEANHHIHQANERLQDLERQLEDADEAGQAEHNLREHLEEALTAARNRYRKLEQDFDDLEGEMFTTQGEKEAMSKTLEEANGKIAELQERCNDLEAQLASLNASMAEGQEAGETSPPENEQDLLDRIEHLQGMYDAARESRDQLLQELSDLQDASQGLSGPSLKCEDKCTDLLRQVEGLQEQVEGLEERVQDLEEQAEIAYDERNESEKQLEECGKHGSDLKQRVEELDKEKTDSEAALAAANADLQTYRAQLDNLEQAMTSPQDPASPDSETVTKLRKLVASKVKFAQAQHEIYKELETTLKDTKSELTLCRQHGSKLQTELDNLKAGGPVAAPASAPTSAPGSDFIAKLKDQIRKLSAEKERAEHRADRHDHPLKARISKLAWDVQQITTALEKCNSHGKELTDKLAAAQANNVQQGETIASLETQLAGLQDSALQAQVKELEDKLDECAKVGDGLRRQIVDMESFHYAHLMADENEYARRPLKLADEAAERSLSPSRPVVVPRGYQSRRRGVNEERKREYDEMRKKMAEERAKELREDESLIRRIECYWGEKYGFKPCAKMDQKDLWAHVPQYHGFMDAMPKGGEGVAVG